jgi:hypothetical protein
VKLTTERAASAQAAAFTGVVREDRAALPGVTVIVRDEATDRQTVTFTDANGLFTIGALKDGVYRVEVSLMKVLSACSGPPLPALHLHRHMQHRLVMTVPLRIAPRLPL